MLGTNLSVKKDSGEWDTEANRLLLMDRKDFNRLGLGVDDLIDAVWGRTADSNLHASLTRPFRPRSLSSLCCAPMP
jgi:hypothetical protein